MRTFNFLFNISKTDITILSHFLHLNKMNIKTNLLEEYVNFVDTTKKNEIKKYGYIQIYLYLH